jgi:taurine dioxygenase
MNASAVTITHRELADHGSRQGDSRMAYQTIEVRKLNPVIGAEIHGIDLSMGLSNRQFEEVHGALMEHLVIFFRDQKMSVEQHKAFGRRFGELHVHPNAPQELEDHPEILVIKADENSKHVAGEEWHSDVSCDEEPPLGSILHMHTVPPDGGGDTMFANMYAAFEALSPPLQRMLEHMTAIHDSAKADGYRAKAGDRNDMNFPRAVHPVVRTHPVTGRKALFVNRGGRERVTQALERVLASPSSSRARARPCLRCCIGTARPPSSCADSAGSPTRWRSGTIAQRSIMRSSIIFRTAATGCA